MSKSITQIPLVGVGRTHLPSFSIELRHFLIVKGAHLVYIQRKTCTHVYTRLLHNFPWAVRSGNECFHFKLYHICVFFKIL